MLTTIAVSIVLLLLSYDISFPRLQTRDANVENLTSSQNNDVYMMGDIFPWFSQFLGAIMSTYDGSQAAFTAYSTFQPSLTLTETRVLKELMEIFHRVMVEQDLFYTLYSGSLIGSYRFHGIIPWDDDVDVAILSRDTESVMKSLLKLSPDYTLYYDPTNYIRSWKLYKRNQSSAIHGCRWRAPFLDISILHTNRTHIWDRSVDTWTSYMYEKALIFPLTRRPFMGIWVNAPNDTKAVIEKSYSLLYCTSRYYSHKLEQVISVFSSVECGQLKDMYPFVVHYPQSMEERLEFKGRRLYTINFIETTKLNATKHKYS